MNIHLIDVIYLARVGLELGNVERVKDLLDLIIQQWETYDDGQNKPTPDSAGSPISVEDISSGGTDSKR